MPELGLLQVDDLAVVAPGAAGLAQHRQAPAQAALDQAQRITLIPPEALSTLGRAGNLKEIK